MSELEKLQRAQYQSRRKRLIVIQAVIAFILILATLFATVAYLRMSRETYVYYTEGGSADYKVYLGENTFYTEEYLDKNHAYIASLIDHVVADFSYDLAMDAASVNYKYAYRIDAQLEIKDRETGAALYDPVYPIKPTQTLQKSENKLSIRERVMLDYHTYNDLASSFIAEYGLRNVTSALKVKMYVDVVGASETFAADNESQYVVELSIPLQKPTVNMQTSTTITQGEQKILTRDSDMMNKLRVAALVLGICSLLMLAFMILFVIYQSLAIATGGA